jgi:ABC-type branched-subunit amino acid transport system ATPase component
MNVKKGTIVSILGPNGAGKSTLLKSIFGIIQPKNGKVIFNGEDITNGLPHEKKIKGISYVPQKTSIFPNLTVEENIKLGGWVIRNNKEKIKDRIESVFSVFPDLAQMKHKEATFLSGGQQKMLEIAKGIVTETQLLLIDEPSAGLAPSIMKQIYQWLVDYKSQSTIILVDQNLRGATQISDYVYIIRLGMNFCEGKASDIETRLTEIMRECLLEDL